MGGATGASKRNINDKEKKKKQPQMQSKKRFFGASDATTE